MAEGQTTLQSGSTYGPFRLFGLLGAGGGGEVWEADDSRNGRRVALKVLTAVKAESPEAWHRFEREARLAASLSHPACVYVFGAEEIDGRPTISMELMRGGTLGDRVGQGPMAYREAVARILDIAEGLEAAHEAGIVHRDIKPSNCFLDEGGTRAKIGDFGISRTLETPRDLSLTGDFIGTPSYASPEQVRGDGLDFRSDLYSLGVTLYELLTGRAPFEGSGLAVAAKILSEAAFPPSRHNPDVPRALDRVVLRLLAKDPARRYASYAALRRALLPFGSESLTPAGLGVRFSAGVLDFLVVGMFAMPLSLLGLSAYTRARSGSLGISLGYSMLLWLPGILYFWILETRWQRSLGKWLMGLRVTSATGEAPTAARVLLRAAAYVFVGQSTGLVQSVWGPVTVPVPLNLMSLCLPYLLLWSTMKRRNGFAGLHELVTGTRVVVAPERPRAVVENRALEPTGDAPSGRFGPYEVVGAVWSQEDEALLVARDPALDRPVWIHTYDDPEGRLPVERLVEPSPHRLVWLQGTRAKRPCWDAYGAPSGRSLMGWLEEDGRLGWGVMGRVLAGVADELASNRVERLGSFTAGRVWIDGAGVPRVLDFPVRHEPDGRPRGIGTPEDIGVLRELAVLGLEGSVRSGSVGAEGPRVPLAAHAREWMRLLFADETSATELLRSRLEHSLARPPSITPARRFVAVLLGAGFVAPMLLMGVLLTTLGRATPGMVEVLSVPALVQEIRGPVGVGVGAAARRDAAVTLLLNAREAIGREPGLEELIRGMLEQGRFGMEWEELVQFMDSLASVAPPPGPEAVERARRLRGTGLGGEGLATLLAVVLLQVGVVATLLAFLFRGGPMLSLLGIEVQRWDGSRASRLRCLGRTALAWSPFLVLPPLFLVLGRMGLTRSGFALSFAGTAFVVALFGIVNELVIPERGLQDRLARVHLMPK